MPSWNHRFSQEKPLLLINDYAGPIQRVGLLAQACHSSYTYTVFAINGFHEDEEHKGTRGLGLDAFHRLGRVLHRSLVAYTSVHPHKALGDKNNQPELACHYP